MNKKLEKKIISNINKLNLKCEKAKRSYFHVQMELDYLQYETIMQINNDIDSLNKSIRLANYSHILLAIALLCHLFSHLLG